MINEDAKKTLKYHFVGIGGIGMSALAQVVKFKGHAVSGSDRKIDDNQTQEMFRKLKSQGIKLYSQDGSGINGPLDFVVVSSAIEKENPDLKIALKNNIPIIKRSELLAGIFNNKNGIAIGGSNGKTTVCGMTSWVLDKAGFDPTIVGGGYAKNYINDILLGNSKPGNSDTVVIEADESDGSLVNYIPKISVITNLSKDHKDVDELGALFSKFADNTLETIIVNESCVSSIRLKNNNKQIVSFGKGNGVDIRVSQIECNSSGSNFEVNGSKFGLNVPGKYNVFNALAAIAVGRVMKVPDSEIKNALGSFMGIKRRMDIVGEKNGIKVIDDYAHNPKKIQSAIEAVRLIGKRVIAVFQPHGYGPTRFLRDGFISSFAENLMPTDVLFMPEIFYAGGTADKSISSKEIIKELNYKGIDAFFVPKREDIANEVKLKAVPGDVVLVMGARDDSLTDLCNSILGNL